MAVDPILLEQVLKTPESRDVTASPIVATVILRDPANAADLVAALERGDAVQFRNARRILCLFGADAAPPFVKALRDAGLRARKEGIEILWAMLLGENPWTVRDVLLQVAADIRVLLDDRRPVVDDVPAYIERDFKGRICDVLFVVLQVLIDAEYDQSVFRSLDERGRDEEIARFKTMGFGPVVA